MLRLFSHLPNPGAEVQFSQERNGKRWFEDFEQQNTQPLNAAPFLQQISKINFLLSISHVTKTNKQGKLFVETQNNNETTNAHP